MFYTYLLSHLPSSCPSSIFASVSFHLRFTLTATSSFFSPIFYILPFFIICFLLTSRLSLRQCHSLAFSLHWSFPVFSRCFSSLWALISKLWASFFVFLLTLQGVKTAVCRMEQKPKRRGKLRHCGRSNKETYIQSTLRSPRHEPLADPAAKRAKQAKLQASVNIHLY